MNSSSVDTEELFDEPVIFYIIVFKFDIFGWMLIYFAYIID